MRVGGGGGPVEFLNKRNYCSNRVGKGSREQKMGGEGRGESRRGVIGKYSFRKITSYVLLRVTNCVIRTFFLYSQPMSIVITPQNPTYLYFLFSPSNLHHSSAFLCLVFIEPIFRKQINTRCDILGDIKYLSFESFVTSCFSFGHFEWILRQKAYDVAYTDYK